MTASFPSRSKGLIIAIDGPSGAGKSTIGRRVAEALGYTYLDTGAMYRALALRALETGVPADDEAGLARAAASARISFDDAGRKVLLDGRDVSDLIRSREATRMASAVAKIAAVRREMVRRQQELGKDGGVVLDGRDIGSVVFPDAEAKFYLDAAPERRARRRHAELQAQGNDASYEAILADIRARDHQDMTRDDSPLVCVPDAVRVDTTELSPDEVVRRLLAVVRDLDQGNLSAVTAEARPRIGFAGLGLMGERMAPHFLTKGYALTVWNRTPSKCEPLRARGAAVARTPRELAEVSDVVFACIADPPAVERLIFAEDGLIHGVRPGFRYVETSTVTPELTKRVDEAIAAKGGAMLEAPVTGSKNGAQNAALLMMTGGRAEVHDELMPLLQVIGAKAIYCGPMGAASFVKLLGNTYISFMLEALAETSVLAAKAGIPLEKVLEVVMASGFASPYYTFKGGALMKRDFDQHFSIDLLVKDQNLMLGEAALRGAPMPGLVAIRDVCQKARDQGLGQDDIIGVVKVLERAAGLP